MADFITPQGLDALEQEITNAPGDTVPKAVALLLIRLLRESEADVAKGARAIEQLHRLLGA